MIVQFNMDGREEEPEGDGKNTRHIGPTINDVALATIISY